MKNILLITALLLCALTAKADKFRWGDSNQNNSSRSGSGYARMNPSNCRCYLYLGKAEIKDGKLALDNLQYICDDVAPNVKPKWNSFGNYPDTDPFLEDPRIVIGGEQQYSIIAVAIGGSKYIKPTEGKELEAGLYFSISIKTYTSTIGGSGEDTYAKMVTSSQFGTTGYWTDDVTITKNVGPVGKGGYACGYPIAGQLAGWIPTSTGGDSDYIKNSNAMYYIYLGLAAIDDRGVIDFSRLTYITNAVPKQNGYGAFGNYYDGIEKSELWQNDLIDPEGGQHYTILVVSKENGSKNPPVLPDKLYDYQTNMYVAVYCLTSETALTKDYWQYARMTIDTQILVENYNNGTIGVVGKTPLAPIVFYDHMEYPPESKYATINIPKTYLLNTLGTNKTDDVLMVESVQKWPNANSPYTPMESYVFGVDPVNPDPAKQPTVLPGLGPSGNTLQLNVSNVTVNPDANADVKYGLISSSSPDFSDPTVETDPQESPALEGGLPNTGVKYYRAKLSIKGK